MTITTINPEELKLPADVKRPNEIIIHGELTGASNEVVVIMYQGFEIFQDAYVCHISLGERGRGIYDLPGFKYLDVSLWTLKERKEITFTMACKTENYDWLPRSNWLW